jgi:hypothetical protein
MTLQNPGRGMPHRSRPSRADSPLPTRLRTWESTVRRVEAGISPSALDCPCCNGENGLDARDELEAVVRRGGRRARRLARTLDPLDERFERATTPAPFPDRGVGWWRTRNLD